MKDGIMKLNPMQTMNPSVPRLALTAERTARLESAASVPDAYIIDALRHFDIRKVTRDPKDISKLVVWNKVPSSIGVTWNHLPDQGNINPGPRLYAEQGQGFPGAQK
jgi:hypothetical protein